MTTPLKIHGVDISHHQNGRIVWPALKRAGIQWMYHKATEGTTVIDDNYARRRWEAKNAAFPFGAYHFARPSGGDARVEAQYFIGVSKPLPGDLRPCLDLETKEHVSGMDLVRWADAFCDEVEKLTGVIPVVYTPYQLSEDLESKAIFWVPRYGTEEKPNQQPERRWDIWQFSNGILGVPNMASGIGHVDLNYSKVSLGQLLIPVKQPDIKFSRGGNVDAAIEKIKLAEKRAREGSKRDSLLKKALTTLKNIKPLR